MILYLLGAALALGLALGAGGMNWWNESRNAARERALAEAQAKVDQLAIKAQTDAANKLIDMSAAYEAGESKAKVIYRTIEKRGADYVASNANLSNPVCRIGPDGLRILNAAITGTELPADFTGTDAGMRTTATDPAGRTGRGDIGSNATPTNDPASGTGTSVRPVQVSPSSGSEGQGGNSGRVRPKPKPVG